MLLMLRKAVVAGVSGLVLWGLAVCSAVLNPAMAAGAPGGLMLGFYAEDAVTNPEDPMLGAFTVNLPQGDAAYSGQMFFTFVGCQNKNVGKVTGVKSQSRIGGKWRGDVDRVPVGGSYSGQYDHDRGVYAGDYVNAGGKLFVEIKNCISYHVAPRGQFALFPAERSWPSTFSLTRRGNTIYWPCPSQAVQIFVAVLDPDDALTNSPAAVRYQGVIEAEPDTQQSMDVGQGLPAGRDSLVMVVAVGDGGTLLSYSSLRITPGR